MRLVLREYLSMLKESGQLDALLPDLLLAMGLEPINRPAIGVRQFGVDIPAVGIDPTDNRRKLFLVTVKQGDINRDGWDSGKQAVRQSLTEIEDSYLRMFVQPEHQLLPKKIILATGGEIKQDVYPDWVSYTERHSGVDARYGEIAFEFWGGDQLAALIETYFLDEYLFPESAQKQIRKTIALVDQNEDEPRQFYTLIEATLFDRDLPGAKTAGAKRKRKQAFRLLNLSLNIVFHWCQDAGNLRPALLCAERLVLRTWDWMRKNDVLDCTTTLEEYGRLFNSYQSVLRAYAIKMHPYCHIQDGLFGHGLDEIEYPLRVFELIGIYGTEVLALVRLFGDAPEEDEDQRVRTAQEIHSMAQTLIALIHNNPGALNPCFDEHAIDIALGLLALTTTGYHQYAAGWIEDLSDRIIFAYQLGHHFPIATDSYNDLIAMSVGEGLPKQKLMALSTLLPMLAEWYAVLNIASYETFRQSVLTVFPETDLQTWYPDTTTDDYLYRTQAGRESGATLSSIELPATLKGMRDRIIHLRQQRDSVTKMLSCIAHGVPILGLIASRHYRTPLLPAYWQELLQHGSSDEVEQ